MVYTYRLNGLDLNRWQLIHGTAPRLDVSMRRQAVNVPGLHGEIAVGYSTAEAPMLPLLLAPEPETGATLEELADDLTALLGAPTLTVQRVTDESTREQAAQLVGHTWDPEQFLCGEEAPVTVVLALPGVFWRDTVDSLVTLAAGTTVLASGQVGSAPVTDAVVRFALDAANPSLTDVATGTGVSVSYDATSTEYVYVDVGAVQAWKSTSSSQWTRPASTALRLDSALDYPGAGLLRIHPTLTGSGHQAQLTASHGAQVRYRKAWW